MRKISLYTFFLCALLIVGAGTFFYPKWKQSGSEATLSWDVSGYYMYLPAFFIYKDAKQCSFQNQVLLKYQPTPDFQQAMKLENGNYVFKYSSGQAVMMSPFFFMGHFIAKKTKWLNDGFSYPYQVCIGIGMLIYALIGLWVLRKILLEYFSDNATALGLFTITFASNYLNYAAIDGAMTHNTLFTVYALLVWATIRFYKNPTVVSATIIGALCGLAALTRPTEIVSVLIPVFWGLGTWSEAGQRIAFFKTNLRYLLAAGFVLICIGSIQPLYWKWVSGHWIVYSYGNEGFDWLSPHFYNGIFSSRSGWITYSPAMLLVFAGFPFLYNKSKQLFFGVAVFSAAFMYLCFAWQTWWYGGSLGIRSMVQSYPLLVIAITAFFEWFLKQAKLWRLIMAAFLLFCTYYNFWLTYQAHKGGLLRAGEMTDAYLKAILFQYEVEPETQFLLDQTDRHTQPPVSSSVIYSNDFEQESAEHATTENAINGKSIFLNQQKQFTPEYSFKVPESTKGWLRVTADFRATQKEWNTWRMMQLVVKFYNDDYVVKSNYIRVFRVLGDGETKRIYLDADIPSESFDRVAVLCWNADSDKLILIDNLKVLLMEE